ncbi:MAG: tRNA pseudouridine(55) synthase TruB, partial [Gaiella sp.]
CGRQRDPEEGALPHRVSGGTLRDAALVAIPKGLDPTGVILVDKPAGPTSFAVLAGVRSRTRAKTGHAGTLDPFATGLLVLLSGRATTLQDRFMKLDKRYVTEIDLSRRSTTGDVDGEPLEEHEPLHGAELEAVLAGLVGTVELPIPAASAVKIEGRRAYDLHRRGVVVEMPVRAMRVHELSVLEVAPAAVTLELHVGSGTYVRSIADALGGHCVKLRRTTIGPFSVDEANPDIVIPVADALLRLPAA